jgi:hypothetical protein
VQAKNSGRSPCYTIRELENQKCAEDCRVFDGKRGTHYITLNQEGILILASSILLKRMNIYTVHVEFMLRSRKDTNGNY